MATAQTVQVMCDQVRKAAADPLVQRSAVDAVKQWRGGPLYGMSGRDPFTSPQAMAESCWWFAKHHVRFVHHNELIAAWFNEHDQLQLLISPEVLVRMRQMEGDCAIYTMLLCAMLEVLGLAWEIVTAAVDPRQPDVFSHVWARVILPDGRRIPLDASHGQYPGWTIPKRRQLRTQVWNESAQPIRDAGQFQGLHGYQMRGMGAVCNPLDADYDAAACEASGSSASSSVNLAALYPAGYPTSSTAPASSAGSFNVAQFLANLANQWTQIGSKVIAPTTSYTATPGGGMTYTAPATSGGLLPTTLLSSGGGSSILWLGGGLVALLLLASAFKK